MKKLIFPILLALGGQVAAQFTLKVDVPSGFADKEVYLYTLSGSKDILAAKETRSANGFTIRVGKPYIGMMRLYFPESNNSFNLVSENKDIKINVSAKGNKLTEVDFQDEANKVMDAALDIQKKKEYILPALYQIQEYYKPTSDFGGAISKEISRLSGTATTPTASLPFTDFYLSNYARFISKDPTQPKPTQQDMQDFLVKSNDMLETSGLMRPVLVAYLNAGGKQNTAAAVDNLLTAVNVETPRGQIMLSELIDIFDMYDMSDLKEKYLAQAQGLKCTINDRLASTIKNNLSVAIGARFADYKFNHPINTDAKSVYGVRADKKIIIFWASTCSHCEEQLPKLIARYNDLKKQNIEVIGLSFDTEAEEYLPKAKMLPWINDAELKGWNSSYADAYNIHGTPTYFVLDKDNKIIAKPDNVNALISFLNLK